MSRVAELTQPSAISILVISSFFFAVNVSHWFFDILFHAGLIGQIAVGVVYGSPLGQPLTDAWETTFWYMGYLGLILIVFEGGLTTSLDTLRDNLVLSCLVAFTGVTLPIGLSIFLLSTAFGYPVMDGFAAGAALAATSLGTTFALLSSSARTLKSASGESLDPRKTRIGSVLLAAALIDDILGLILASLIPSITTSTGSSSSSRTIAEAVARPIGAPIGLFLILEIAPLRKTIVGGLRIAAHLVQRYPSAEDGALLTVLVALICGFVAAAYYAGASMLFGAWIPGVLIRQVDDQIRGSTRSTDEVSLERSTGTPSITSNPDHSLVKPKTYETAFIEHIMPIQTHILSPLFFASIGTAIPFLSLWTGHILWRGIVYSLLMVIAKMAVGFCILLWPARISQPAPPNFPRPSLPVFPALLLSVAMVARGEIGLLIAQIANLSDDVYKLVMWAVLVCTLVGPIGTGWMLRWKGTQCFAGEWG